MSLVFALMTLGCSCGLLLGAVLDAFTSEGIWPDTWAGLVLAGGLIGMSFGFLAMLFQ